MKSYSGENNQQGEPDTWYPNEQCILSSGFYTWPPYLNTQRLTHPKLFRFVHLSKVSTPIRKPPTALRKRNTQFPFALPNPTPSATPTPASPLLSTPPPRPNLPPHPPQTPLIPSSNTTLPRNPTPSLFSPPKAPARKTSPLSLREENDHVRNQAPRARSSLISPYPGLNPKSSSIYISPKSQRQTPLTIRPHRFNHHLISYTTVSLSPSRGLRFLLLC